MKTNKDKTNVEDIKKAIRMRLEHIRDKKIFENAVEVVRELGSCKQSVHSDHIGETGSFEELFGQNTLKIEYHTFGQFDENSKVKVFFEGKLVFGTEHSAWFPKSDPEKIEKTINLRGTDKNGPFLIVDVYKTGGWEDWLSVKRIKSYRRDRFLKQEDDRIKTEKDQKTREFWERAESVMEDLGIELK